MNNFKVGDYVDIINPQYYARGTVLSIQYSGYFVFIKGFIKHLGQITKIHDIGYPSTEAFHRFPKIPEYFNEL